MACHITKPINYILKPWTTLNKAKNCQEQRMAGREFASIIGENLAYNGDTDTW